MPLLRLHTNRFRAIRPGLNFLNHIAKLVQCILVMDNNSPSIEHRAQAVYHHFFAGYRSSDPERRILNTEKIRTRTDWTPIITLDKGLDMCIASIEK